MEGLLPAFVAALLGEFGDKTQALSAILAARFKRAGGVIAGIAIAAILNAAIGAAGGALIGAAINHRACLLLLGLALLLAGGGAFLPYKEPSAKIDGAAMGPIAASAFAHFVLAFGEKTQFVTIALAAETRAPVLVGLGAAAGVIAGSVPAVLLGPELAKRLPLAALRYAIGTLYVVVALVIGVNALGLD